MTCPIPKILKLEFNKINECQFPGYLLDFYLTFLQVYLQSSNYVLRSVALHLPGHSICGSWWTETHMKIKRIVLLLFQVV